MNNPFEREDRDYFVLVNDEGQHSLWPAFITVPQGWSIVLGQTNRQACIDYINENWSDLRPRSLHSVN
ncbi:MbtH-like protein [compost metagenome]